MKIKYIKILFIFILAFFLSSFFVKNVFIAYTPKFRPQWYKILLANFFENFNNIKRSGSKSVATADEKIKNNASLSSLIKITEKDLIPIQKGIYAAEFEGKSITIIKQDEVEWIEYSFNVGGKEIKVKVPKGQAPPTQEMMEQIYK